MNPNKKSFAMNILRRGSYRYFARWKALNNAKIARGEYFCQICGIVGKKKEFQLDHIIPVVPLEGFDSFDGVIDRLYCDPDGLQNLCIACHKEKTKGENQERPRLPKKEKKPKKKKAR
jgi:5-methylcytosine-specific restriction endonuclease McrA